MLSPVVLAEALVASHRGSVSQAPENTLAAFRWAEAVGADVVEADLRMAADGSLVVIHDARVNRTTNGRGKVSDLSLGVLKDLDAGNGQPIPTFAEALAFVRTSDLHLLLDVKDSEQIEAQLLIAAIQGQRVEQQVLIGSRSARLVSSLKAQAPDLRVLAMVPDVESIDEFLTYDVDAVRLWARWVRKDPALVAAVRRAGAEVWLTTGGMRGRSLARAMRVADGVITNHPTEALYLSQLRPPRAL
jgi:glycerophosphoryl diester phosphodiesterase